MFIEGREINPDFVEVVMEPLKMTEDSFTTICSFNGYRHLYRIYEDDAYTIAHKLSRNSKWRYLHLKTDDYELFIKKNAIKSITSIDERSSAIETEGFKFIVNERSSLIATHLDD